MTIREEANGDFKTDDRGGYHLSRCHTPLSRVLQVFINKAF